MASTYTALFWKAFKSMMQSNGWEERILFMRGTKWIKGDEEIIYDAQGWHLNGELVSEKEIIEFF